MVTQGLAASRSRARLLVEEGSVMDCAGKTLRKAGQMLPAETRLTLKDTALRWVSRGGLKLAHALEHFSLNPAGQILADIGASTGGFTDVLRHYKAAHIYAVDVGTDQLYPSLRDDPHVTSLEQTNARDLNAEILPDPLDGLVCDASFISLKLVLPAAMALVKPDGWLVALIKPQFEVGKHALGKDAIVKDPAIHQQLCDDLQQWFNQQNGWRVQAITPSPITGPKGNKEFLLYARKSNQ